MHFLHHHLNLNLRRHHYHHHIRTLYDGLASIKIVGDRGLDHAVSRERHLKPLIDLKNLIISEPSKSLPLSVIANSKDSLQIPFRPIDFIRKYPSVFVEFHPGNLSVHPHIKLTPETVSLDSDESLLYQSVNYKQDIAKRLLKLLMICRINKIPISLLESIKWELGLPQDYEKVVIPEFPDYFRVIDGGNERLLELVCWDDELAVSHLEKKGEKNCKIEFILKYSNGFEMDKKHKKWVDEWQKLPYISPYENAMHLSAKSDESDKWVVAVLHEVLNLFVGKKADRESVFSVGEWLGLRSRFKRAMLEHPGIFYVSGRNGMHTLVLRDAYKRGMLIESDSLMDMRFKYVSLMNITKEEDSSKSEQEKSSKDLKDGKEGSEDAEVGEEDGEVYDLSDDDGDDDDDDDDDEDVDETHTAPRARSNRKVTDFDGKNLRRAIVGKADRRNRIESEDRSSRKLSRRNDFHGDRSAHSREPQDRRNNFESRDRSSGRFFGRNNLYGDRDRFDSGDRSSGRFSKRSNFHGDRDHFESRDRNSGRFSRGSDSHGERNNFESRDRSSGRFSKRSDFHGDRDHFEYRDRSLGRFSRRSEFHGERNNFEAWDRSSGRFSERSDFHSNRRDSRRQSHNLDTSGERPRSRKVKNPV